MLLPMLILATSQATVTTNDIELGISTFGRRLAAAVPVRPNENVLFSPFSVASCLALLLPGVGDADRQHLAAALHLPDQPATALDEGFRRLNASLIGTETPSMAVANSLWAGPGVALIQSYRDELLRAFAADAATLPATGTRGANVINDWVRTKTKDRIPRLFDSLPDDLVVALVNAVAFDGQWATPFPPERTSAAPFNAPGGSLRVATMATRHNLPYGEGQGYQLVRLPYAGNQFWMTILLPDPGGDPRRLLSDFDSANMPQTMAASVDLYLPKFKFSTNYDLTETLTALGLDSFKHAFDASQMVANSRPLYISKLAHAGFIEVDEHGTKAAATTGGIARPTAILVPPKRVEFRVDRPFAFIITFGGLPIFMGAVYRPGP